MITPNLDNLRAFIRQHYTDARLAEVTAFAQDRKLGLLSCCCFIGCATATHALVPAADSMEGMNTTHYHQAKIYLPGAREAEFAFAYLGDTDEERRRRIIPILEAEMRRRESERALASPSEITEPEAVLA